MNFGDCLSSPGVTGPGGMAVARFVAGNPRNHLMHEDSFLTVEQKQPDDKWVVVQNDADFETM